MASGKRIDFFARIDYRELGKDFRRAGVEMAEPNVDAALYTKLTEDMGLNALVGTKIYYEQAPAGTALPYVIFAPAGGGEVNATRRRMIEQVWRVEGVASTKAEATALDSAISSALHEQELMVSGWSNWVMDREMMYAPPTENDQGVQIWRRGAYYRVKLVKLNL